MKKWATMCIPAALVWGWSHSVAFSQVVSTEGLSILPASTALNTSGITINALSATGAPVIGYSEFSGSINFQSDLSGSSGAVFYSSASVLPSGAATAYFASASPSPAIIELGNPVPIASPPPPVVGPVDPVQFIQLLTRDFSFCSLAGGPDSPRGKVIQGRDGNFYGSCSAGGSSGYGAIFKMTPQGVVTTLVSFNNVNGANPWSSLVQGRDGDFYGTTSQGGSHGYGTVFKVTAQGTLTTLASFNQLNGAYPHASLIQGRDGNFYGTASAGGAAGPGAGTIFKVTIQGKLTTVVSFGGADGADPEAALVEGVDGNFYGTTAAGGSMGLGTVFKMTPEGSLTTLVSFSQESGTSPAGALVQASDGNFYGTCAAGGTGGSGIAFKITPNGALTTLASFNDLYLSSPEGGLLLASDGNFYGTTSRGLGFNAGAVFKMTPEGALTSLALFDPFHGVDPFDTLIQATDGSFYGTTFSGGSFSDGTVFQLSYIQPTAEAILESGRPFTIQLSNYGLEGIFGCDSVLPSWISFDAADGLLAGTAPVQPGGLLGTVNVHDTAFEVPLNVYLVNPVAGSSADSLDIGDVAQQGQTEYNPATGFFTLTGSGAGLGTSDDRDFERNWDRKSFDPGYQFAYAPVTGDFTIQVKVEGLEEGGESGILVKDALSVFSSHVAVVYKAGVGVVAEYNTGSSPEMRLGRHKIERKDSIQIGLVRSGNTFIEYVWKNGAWAQLGTVTFPNAPQTLYLGLVESSDDHQIKSTATFEDLNILPYAE